MSDKHEQLTAKLAELDPVGLIRIGAPRNEYRHEARSIWERRQDPDLTAVCYEVFNAAFFGLVDDVNFKEMARALEPLLNP